ncbi:MAG: response regulator [Angelakisella sp.]|nr:response regulator [Angelakisella sp.]
MLNAIIIDDEKPSIKLNKLLLEKTGEIRVVGTSLSALQALSMVQSLKPDVVFLDIEMPEMSGLELAEKILETNNDIEIVFVTAYEKYALEAFRVNAIHYILKPLSPESILQTVTRLKKIRPLQDSVNQLSHQGRIYCFGKLLVYGVGYGTAVRWRTSKAEELFAFMVQNLNKEVSKWKITEALWPECETEKLNVNLHTTIYQVKKTLLSANIKFYLTFINGRYKLELPGIYIDTAEFEAATYREIVLSEASLQQYEKALSLYKGDYLEENQYFWSQSKAEEYSSKYRCLVCELSKYYEHKKDYKSAQEILQKALTKFPLDDTLNEYLLKLFFIKNDKASLMMFYNKMKELYQSELGILPNATMTNLYNRIFEL